MARVREISPIYAPSNRQEAGELTWVQENGRTFSALPYLDKTVKLSKVVWVQRNWLCSLLSTTLGRQTSQNNAGELTLVVTMRESQQADQLGYYPGPEPGLQSSSPNTHFIYELLECVKGTDLQVQIYRISRTKGNSRISKTSLSEGQALRM